MEHFNKHKNKNTEIRKKWPKRQIKWSDASLNEVLLLWKNQIKWKVSDKLIQKTTTTEKEQMWILENENDQNYGIILIFFEESWKT